MKFLYRTWVIGISGIEGKEGGVILKKIYIDGSPVEYIYLSLSFNIIKLIHLCLIKEPLCLPFRPSFKIKTFPSKMS